MNVKSPPTKEKVEPIISYQRKVKMQDSDDSIHKVLGFNVLLTKHFKREEKKKYGKLH